MWADVLVDRRAWVRLARDPAGPESAVLPLVGGVVRADQLTWRAVDITPDDVEQATPDVAPPSPLPPAPSTIVLEPVPVQPPPLPPPLPVAATPDEAPREGPDFFDELWGMTQPRTVESAAVREDDDEEDLGPALLDIIPGLSGAALRPGHSPDPPRPPPNCARHGDGRAPGHHTPAGAGDQLSAGPPEPADHLDLPGVRRCGHLFRARAGDPPRLGVLVVLHRTDGGVGSVGADRPQPHGRPGGRTRPAHNRSAGQYEPRHLAHHAESARRLERAAGRPAPATAPLR